MLIHREQDRYSDDGGDHGLAGWTNRYCSKGSVEVI
jgi:hypothetical protein